MHIGAHSVWRAYKSYSESVELFVHLKIGLRDVLNDLCPEAESVARSAVVRHQQRVRMTYIFRYNVDDISTLKAALDDGVEPGA